MDLHNEELRLTRQDKLERVIAQKRAASKTLPNARIHGTHPEVMKRRSNYLSGTHHGGSNVNFPDRHAAKMRLLQHELNRIR